MDLLHRILQKKFFRLRLCQRIESFCPRFAEAVYPLGCFLPSFLEPDVNVLMSIEIKILPLVEY